VSAEHSSPKYEAVAGGIDSEPCRPLLFLCREFRQEMVVTAIEIFE